MAILPDFAEIVRDNQAMVFSMALHALDDRDAAEDMAQDVFLALHGHLHRLASPQHVKHWLARVTSNRCVDEIRRRRLRRGPSLEEVPEARSRAEQSDPLLSRQLRQMVASLPPKARMMIILRYQEDLEIGEIARILDIPAQSVKSRLHRSVSLLRERMFRRQAAAQETQKAWTT